MEKTVGKIMWTVFVLLILVYGVKGLNYIISQPVPKSLPEVVRVVKIDYQVDFGWVYTGTPDAYSRYIGQATFLLTADDQAFRQSDIVFYQGKPAMIGMPIHNWAPMGTIIPFETVFGEKYDLHVGVSNGAVIGPWGAKAADKILYIMSTEVTRAGPDDYRVKAIPYIHSSHSRS